MKKSDGFAKCLVSDNGGLNNKGVGKWNGELL